MRNVILADPNDATNVRPAIEITGFARHLGVLVTRDEAGPSRVNVI
jgi:hypothetical protein